MRGIKILLELFIKLKDADEADIVLPIVQKMIAEGYTASINPMYKKYLLNLYCNVKQASEY